jgi:hypothetical protein
LPCRTWEAYPVETPIMHPTVRAGTASKGGANALPVFVHGHIVGGVFFPFHVGSDMLPLCRYPLLGRFAAMSGIPTFESHLLSGCLSSSDILPILFHSMLRKAVITSYLAFGQDLSAVLARIDH